MKLYLSERLISFKEDFDVKDDEGVLFTVKSHWVSVGKKMDIIDVRKREKVAVLDEKVFTILPKCVVKLSNGDRISINKRITFFEDGYKINPLGWKIKGDIFDLNYRIYDKSGDEIAYISKRLISMTDSYVIEIFKEAINPAIILSVVISIDIINDKEDKKREKNKNINQK